MLPVAYTQSSHSKLLQSLLGYVHHIHQDASLFYSQKLEDSGLGMCNQESRLPETGRVTWQLTMSETKMVAVTVTQWVTAGQHWICWEGEYLN